MYIHRSLFFPLQMTCGVCTQLCVHVQLKSFVEGGVCRVLGLGLGVGIVIQRVIKESF